MRFNKIGLFAVSGALFFSISGFFAGQAQQLDVPVMEKADLDLDTCSLGKVIGLDPRGDGFLAVRSGPGTQYRTIDKLHSGDRVWMFDRRGRWIGVAYGVDDVECSPIKVDRKYRGPGKAGWVHESFIRGLAG